MSFSAPEVVTTVELAFVFEHFGIQQTRTISLEHNHLKIILIVILLKTKSLNNDRHERPET